MKKQLLFAAMLAIGAAPALASESILNTPAVAIEAADAQVTYETLVKTLADFKNDLTSLLAMLQEKYPEAETPISAIDYTINGEGGLKEMETEINAKHEAGTLTDEEIKTYMATIDQWKETFTEEAIISMAQSEQWQSDLYKAANAANEAISESMAEFYEDEEATLTYYNTIVDNLSFQISNVTWTLPDPLTETDVKEAVAKIDSLKEEALKAAELAKIASEFVDNIPATLKVVDEQVAQIKADGLYCDEETIEESKEYWQQLATALTNELGEDEEPMSKADLEEAVEYFGYFQEEAGNLYNNAKAEVWQSEYYSKYSPISERIYEIMGILDQECSQEAAEKYMTQLDDLNAEMTQATMKFYMGTVTEEDFKTMMSRADEIAKEIEVILENARKETPTGIDGIATGKSSADAIYTIGGKRISTLQKGINIVNGKKVIIK